MGYKTPDITSSVMEKILLRKYLEALGLGSEALESTFTTLSSKQYYLLAGFALGSGEGLVATQEMLDKAKEVDK